MITNDLSRVPHFGFGLMRLPLTVPKDPTSIDIEQLEKMVDAYMKKGFTYFDTAYPYHKGLSEVATRKALVERYDRESFLLADKLPAWSINQEEDLDRIFNEQLERTGAGYFDFYLMHAVDDSNFANYEKYDCFNFGLKKKEEGKIRHLGFSVHGTPEMLVKILDKYPFVEFVQIQLNYLDWDSDKVYSGKLYEILSSRNIPIVVMEPIKGGSLAQLKPELEGKFKALRPDASIASWALRYVGSLPGVMTLLSGMSLLEQMEDNVKTFTNFEALSKEELKTVKEVVEVMKQTPQIGCTACSYCTDGCPMNIGIPNTFRIINTINMYGKSERTDKMIENMLKKKAGPADCIQCGQCEGVCPQHLPIIELLKDASKIIG